jgi:nickel/cobalt transporter (NicO) family protein
MLADSLMLGGTMFSLGVLHALEPTHGKLFWGGVVLQSAPKAKHAILLSLLTALLQTVVLMALVGVLALFSVQVLHDVVEPWEERLAAVSFVLMGLVMLWHQFQHSGEKPQCCGSNHTQALQAVEPSAEKRPWYSVSSHFITKLLPLMVLWAIAPCPFALTALLSGFANGQVAMALISALLFGLGVASILISSVVCFLYGSHFVAHRLAPFERYLSRFSTLFATGLVGFGVILFFF